MRERKSRSVVRLTFKAQSDKELALHMVAEPRPWGARLSIPRHLHYDSSFGATIHEDAIYLILVDRAAFAGRYCRRRRGSSCPGDLHLNVVYQSREWKAPYLHTIVVETDERVGKLRGVGGEGTNYLWSKRG